MARRRIRQLKSQGILALFTNPSDRESVALLDDLL
jgi:hypothetical protein